MVSATGQVISLDNFKDRFCIKDKEQFLDTISPIRLTEKKRTFLELYWFTDKNRKELREIDLNNYSYLPKGYRTVAYLLFTNSLNKDLIMSMFPRMLGSTKRMLQLDSHTTTNKEVVSFIYEFLKENDSTIVFLNLHALLVTAMNKNPILLPKNMQLGVFKPFVELLDKHEFWSKLNIYQNLDIAGAYGLKVKKAKRVIKILAGLYKEFEEPRKTELISFLEMNKLDVFKEISNRLDKCGYVPILYQIIYAYILRSFFIKRKTILYKEENIIRYLKALGIEDKELIPLFQELLDASIPGFGLTNKNVTGR